MPGAYALVRGGSSTPNFLEPSPTTSQVGSGEVNHSKKALALVLIFKDATEPQP